MIHDEPAHHLVLTTIAPSSSLGKHAVEARRRTQHASYEVSPQIFLQNFETFGYRQLNAGTRSTLFQLALSNCTTGLLPTEVICVARLVQAAMISCPSETHQHHVVHGYAAKKLSRTARVGQTHPRLG